MGKFKIQIPIRYGLIAFSFIITIGLLMWVFYQSIVSSFVLFAAIGFFSLALALFLGIWSGITYRRENGGVISFSHAFLAVYLVFVFNALGTTTSLNLINKVIDKDYAHKASALLKEKMTDRFEKMNMTDEQIKEAMKNMSEENFNPPFVKQLQSLAISLAISAVIAAIIAAFIKRGSSDLISTGTPPEPIRTI
jgi:hypothetical protein